jgi:hypothetical protein
MTDERACSQLTQVKTIQDVGLGLHRGHGWQKPNRGIKKKIQATLFISWMNPLQGSILKIYAY